METGAGSCFAIHCTAPCRTPTPAPALPRAPKIPFCNWSKQTVAGIFPQVHWKNGEMYLQLHSIIFKLELSCALAFGMAQRSFSGQLFWGASPEVRIDDDFEPLPCKRQLIPGFIMSSCLARAAACRRAIQQSQESIKISVWKNPRHGEIMRARLFLKRSKKLF